MFFRHSQWHYNVSRGAEVVADDLFQEQDVTGAAIDVALNVGDWQEEVATYKLDKDTGENAIEVAGDCVGMENGQVSFTAKDFFFFWSKE